MKRYVVCITGASGTIYGRRLIWALASMGHEVHIVVSPAGVEVMEKEEEVFFSDDKETDPFLEGFPKVKDARLKRYSYADISAPIASGSFPVDASAIVPCSMATVGAVASGAGRNLIHRLADVAIKERRRLVIAPRETPLSKLHLENMAALAAQSVRVVPCMPGFYHTPRSVMEMVDFVVHRVGHQLGVELDLVPPWNPEATTKI